MFLMSMDHTSMLSRSSNARFITKHMQTHFHLCKKRATLHNEIPSLLLTLMYAQSTKYPSTLPKTFGAGSHVVGIKNGLANAKTQEKTCHGR